MLAKALAAAGGAAAPAAAVAEALRGYERERVARAMPVTVKSHVMGAMLQIRNPWVSHTHLILMQQCSHKRPGGFTLISSPCNDARTQILF